MGEFLARSLAAERDRWALWLPVLFGAGVAAYFALPGEPPGAVGLAIAVGGLALVAALWRRGGFGVAIALVLFTAGAGFTTAQLRADRVSAPTIQKRIGPVTVEGRALFVEQRKRGFRVVFDRLEISRLSPADTPERVRIKLHGKPTEFAPGDRVNLRAILMPPPGPAAPGAFDFARQAFFKRIGGVGFAFGPVRVISRAEGGWSWSVALGRLRNDLTQRILAALDAPRGAVAAALMTGERGAIPEDVLAAMRDAGLAHILAISGLHVGLVAGILFFALRLLFASIEPLVLRRPVKKWAAAVALVGAFGYLLIAGATVPTQRAFIMLAVILIAVMLDRTALSMRVVALAAALVLLLAPESLLSASFQLSFAAVIALIAAYESLGPRMSAWRGDGGRGRRIALYVAGIALTTLIAGLATGPFAAYHFNRVALYGVAANLVAIPLTGLWIMPWAVAAFALMPFGLEELALAPMGWGIGALIEVARTVASWPGASALLPAMPPYAIGLVAFGGLWLCLWRTRWRLAGVAVIAAGLAVLPLVRGPDILVDGSGRLMAVRSPGGGLALSSTRTAKFEGEMWLRRSGQRSAVAWPGEGLRPNGRLACDSMGCIVHAGGATVALVYQVAALAEDCYAATVVVSVVPVRRYRCRQPERVIDRFDLWRRGAHALWLEKDGIRVESVADIRGVRPWSPARARSKGRAQ